MKKKKKEEIPKRKNEKKLYFKELKKRFLPDKSSFSLTKKTLNHT